MKLHDDNPERYGDPDPSNVKSWDKGIDSIYPDWFQRPMNEDRSDVLFLIGAINALYRELTKMEIEKTRAILVSGGPILDWGRGN